jgi:hypothetical protein
MEGVKTNYYEFDHWMVYSSPPSSLHYYYSYDNSEDWDYGDQGWVTENWSGKAEVTSVLVDEYGVFTIPLTWNEKRTASAIYSDSEVPTIRNRWGLIPLDNYQIVYLCDWGPREMPTGLETLTAENFRDRCGPSGYYFECGTSGK